MKKAKKYKYLKMKKKNFTKFKMINNQKQKNKMK